MAPALLDPWRCHNPAELLARQLCIWGQRLATPHPQKGRPPAFLAHRPPLPPHLGVQGAGSLIPSLGGTLIPGNPLIDSPTG